jgi:hypothetical protein
MAFHSAVVTFSDGFNRFPGEGLYSILRANGVNDSSLKFEPLDNQTELDKILRLGVAHDVRFYTLDLRGRYGDADAIGSGRDASSHGASAEVRHGAMVIARQNTDALSELARETGACSLRTTTTC